MGHNVGHMPERVFKMIFDATQVDIYMYMRKRVTTPENP